MPRTPDESLRPTTRRVRNATPGALPRSTVVAVIRDPPRTRRPCASPSSPPRHLVDSLSPRQQTCAARAPSNPRAPALVRRCCRRPDIRRFAESLPTPPKTSSDRRARGPGRTRTPSRRPACRIATSTPDDRRRVCRASAPAPWSRQLVNTRRPADPGASRPPPARATRPHASPNRPALHGRSPDPLRAPASRPAGTAADDRSILQPQFQSPHDRSPDLCPLCAALAPASLPRLARNNGKRASHAWSHAQSSAPVLHPTARFRRSRSPWSPRRTLCNFALRTESLPPRAADFLASVGGRDAACAGAGKCSQCARAALRLPLPGATRRALHPVTSVADRSTFRYAARTSGCAPAVTLPAALGFSDAPKPTRVAVSRYGFWDREPPWGSSIISEKPSKCESFRTRMPRNVLRRRRAP